MWRNENKAWHQCKVYSRQRAIKNSWSHYYMLCIEQIFPPTIGVCCQERDRETIRRFILCPLRMKWVYLWNSCLNNLILFREACLKACGPSPKEKQIFRLIFVSFSKKWIAWLLEVVLTCGRFPASLWNCCPWPGAPLSAVRPGTPAASAPPVVAQRGVLGCSATTVPLWRQLSVCFVNICLGCGK